MAAQQTVATTKTRDRGMHSLILTVGGTIWAVFGVAALQGLAGVTPFIGAGILALALAISSLVVINTNPAATGASPWANIRRQYLQINRLTYGGIIVTAIACSYLKQNNYIMPVVAIIVGLHFFALGPLFASRSAYVKGAILCLVGVITMVALPAHVTVSGQQILLWGVVPGFVVALAYWLDALLTLTSALRPPA